MADQILSNNPVPPERIPCIHKLPQGGSEAIKKRINENIELILASGDLELLKCLDQMLIELVRAQRLEVTETGRRHSEGGGA